MTDISEESAADLALIRRAVARDEQAIAELYDRHSRLLFGLILRVLQNRSEAEDVLQEVFLSVWTKADSYRPSLGSPVGWLVGIARNRAIDRLRSNIVRLRTTEVSYAPTSVDNPEVEAARGERQRDVARALNTLPPDQRVLIEEAYFRGLTQSELAIRFGLPLGTVKTRVRNGMLVLRQQLGESALN